MTEHKTFTAGAGELKILHQDEWDERPDATISVYGYISFRHLNPNQRFPIVGDEAIIDTTNGNRHHFRFVQVRLAGDPDDMYTADIKRYKVTDKDGAVVWEDEPQFKDAMQAYIEAMSDELPPTWVLALVLVVTALIIGALFYWGV